jgi:hypothetical protein
MGFTNYFLADSMIFEGEWLNNVKSGYGKMICDGVVYKGIWSNDRRNGFGVMAFKGFRYFL